MGRSSVWYRRMKDYGSGRALACEIQPSASNGLPLI